MTVYQKSSKTMGAFTTSARDGLPKWVEYTFIQKRFHPLTLSSKNDFIQLHFHPKTISSKKLSIQSLFHPMTHPKTVSSKKFASGNTASRGASQGCDRVCTKISRHCLIPALWRRANWKLRSGWTTRRMYQALDAAQNNNKSHAHWRSVTFGILSFFCGRRTTKENQSAWNDRDKTTRSSQPRERQVAVITDHGCGWRSDIHS